MSEPHARWMTVTPERARDLLASSRGNRNLRLDRIHQYASDMRAGRWDANGETLKIDTDGRLGDGHHRCHAVVRANIPVRMLVVYNVSEEALQSVDGGTPRNPADRLTMAGELNSKALAAALRWQYRYQRSEDSQMLSTVKLYGAEVFETLDAHPGMRNAVKDTGKYRTVASLMSQAMLGFALYNTPNSGAFWSSLDDGAGLSVGSPILLLRNRLIANKASKARLNDIDVLALVIKAHNAWKKGDRLRTLRWRNVGDAAEAFPRWVP